MMPRWVLPGRRLPLVAAHSSSVELLAADSAAAGALRRPCIPLDKAAYDEAQRLRSRLQGGSLLLHTLDNS